MKRLLYAILYFLWICVPAGLGCPPVHRWNKIFRLENDTR